MVRVPRGAMGVAALLAALLSAAAFVAVRFLGDGPQGPEAAPSPPFPSGFITTPAAGPAGSPTALPTAESTSSATASPAVRSSRVVQANGASGRPMLSGNGRYAAFETSATNLVAGDTDRSVDIVVRDRVRGGNVLASVDDRGRKLRTGVLLDGISEDGARVLFETRGGAATIYLRDLRAKSSVLVARGRSASLSPDGGHVVFLDSSDAVVVVDLHTGARNVVGSVVRRHDVVPSRLYAPSLSRGGGLAAFAGEDESGRPVVVLAGSIGTQRVAAPDTRPGDGMANVVLSADGSRVAFQYSYSCAPGLPPCSSVWIADVAGPGAPVAVSVSRSGAVVYDTRDDVQVAISGNGRRVSFVANSAALVDRDTNGCKSETGDPACADVFVRDLTAGVTLRASVSSGGAQARGTCSFGALAIDGTSVAFLSDAPNLVPRDTNGVADVFVHDLRDGVTGRASIAQA